MFQKFSNLTPPPPQSALRHYQEKDDLDGRLGRIILDLAKSAIKNHPHAVEGGIEYF